MSITNYTIKLHSLKCYAPDERTDEVYLMANDKKIWPKNEKYRSMKIGASEDLKIETTVAKGASIKIELWEYDLLTADDNLGKFILEADKIGGPRMLDMIKTDAGKSKYAITWGVH
jgi:hypothetical protein